MTSVFEQPQCLIFTEQKTGKLCMNQHVLDDIASITKRINAVAIAGLYRTGKSYRLTRLSGKNKGFPLGSSIQSKTKGIWAWCVDHPKHKDQMLLLLDTEGLGDIEKGDQNNDNKVFTLATLLSSTLIYNQLGAFNDDALNKLTFITEMSRNIRESDNDQSVSSDDAFDVYFPEFILTLRDFTLELVVDGKEISSDEYLDDVCLKAKSDDSDESTRFNEPRLCIRKYFKLYSNLANNYVEAIRQGAIPCIQTALKSMSIIENEAAVEEAVGIYLNEMKTNVEMPTEHAQLLTDIHLKSKELAFNHFLKRRVLDDEDTYKRKFDNIVIEEYNKWVTENENMSKIQCKKALDKLHENISKRINAGAYAIPDGYKIYSRDHDQLKLEYYETLGLGVMKDQAFVAFCTYMKNEAEAVLKSDQSISEKEIALNLERENRNRAEAREEIMTLKLAQLQKESEDIAKQHDMEYKKLQQVHQKEMANERARMDKLTEQRIQEMDRLQKENLQGVLKQNEIQLQKFQANQDAKEKVHLEQMFRANQQLVKDKESMIKNMEDQIRKNNAKEESDGCTIS